MPFGYSSPTEKQCSFFVADFQCQQYLLRCSNCTCDQARQVGASCDSMQWLYSVLNAVTESYLSMIFMCLGIVCNVLLLMTLMQRIFFNATTFIYIRLLAVVGLMLMVLQLVRKVMVSYVGVTVNSYGETMFAYSYAYTTNYVKLFLSTFSTCLCLDRTVSILLPIWYSRFNRPRYVLVAFVVSTLIAGTTVLYPGAVVSIVDPRTNREFLSVANNAQAQSYRAKAVLGIRMAEAGLMIVFSVVIVGRLVQRNRRLQSMLPAESSQRDDRRSLNLCRFQILETFVSVIDLIMLCLNDVVLMLPAYHMFQVRYEYEDYQRYSVFLQMANITQVFQVIAFQFSQFLMFFMYLAFSRMFREGFLRMVLTPFRFCKLNVVRPSQEQTPIELVLANNNYS